jgi:hypothetical protein
VCPQGLEPALPSPWLPLARFRKQILRCRTSPCSATLQAVRQAVLDANGSRTARYLRLSAIHFTAFPRGSLEHIQVMEVELGSSLARQLETSVTPS